MTSKRSARCWSRAARAATCGSSTLNQIRHLGFTAPDELRERLRDVHRRPSRAHRRRRCDPTPAATPSCTRRRLAIATLGRRVLALDADDRTPRPSARHARAHDRARACSRSTASGSTPPRSCWSPPATTRTGSATKPRSRISAASHPSPRRPARPPRHRLNPGGNRQANHALWRIVFTRMGSDERTRKYVARRLAEGRTKPRDHARPEALRRPRDLPAPPRATEPDLEWRAWPTNALTPTGCPSNEPPARHSRTTLGTAWPHKSLPSPEWPITGLPAPPTTTLDNT